MANGATSQMGKRRGVTDNRSRGRKGMRQGTRLTEVRHMLARANDQRKQERD